MPIEGRFTIKKTNALNVRFFSILAESGSVSHSQAELTRSRTHTVVGLGLV